MNVFFITDIHGNIAHLESSAELIQKADLVLIAGDITNFGSVHDAEQILNKIRQLNKNIFAVAGNCDSQEIDGMFFDQGIGLNGTVRNWEQLQLAGISGSLKTPTNTPFEYKEKDMEGTLETIKKQMNGRPLLLVSHQPAFHTKTDRVMGWRHVGSKALRSFIEEIQPILTISGHIHESVGMDNIGVTKVINPGAFKDGHYGLAEIEGDSVSDLTWNRSK
ncbi:MAG: metallophosphoesterase [Spirochaetia bacterium]